MAPVVEDGSVRLKIAPEGDIFHLILATEDAVVFDGDVFAGAGEVIEIAGPGLAAYELAITAKGRPPARFQVELTTAMPCAAFEIAP